MSMVPKKPNEENNNQDGKKIDINNFKKSIKSKGDKNKFLQPKDMNFFERYEIVVEGKQEKINPMFFIVPTATVLGILIVAFAIINVMSAVVNNSNKKLQAYVDDTNNIASYNQAVQLSNEISKRNSSKVAIEEILKAMGKYPSINEAFISSIYGSLPEGITIQNINYDSAQGYFSMSCVSTNVNAIPDFINNLEATNRFAVVGYTGYNGGSGGYTFTVNCICNGN